MNNSQDFKWRPNDNSVSTKVKYDLEAEHWYSSYKSAEIKYQSNENSLVVIGLILKLLVNIVFMAFLGVHELIKCLKRQF